MYTSYIGNKFLKIYRQRNNLPDDYTARQFFEEVLFPLFFDDENFFMSVHSSPFDQLFAESGAKFSSIKKPLDKVRQIIKKLSNNDDKKTDEIKNLQEEEKNLQKKLNSFVPLHKVREHRVRKLNELHQKIENGEIGGNTAVGYYSLDLEATSSGQITSMKNFVTAEGMYASWIGHALSIRIDGGLILIDNEKVLWTLFEGWKSYREYLTKTPKIKDKQVEAWNGHWLSHAFGENFESDNIWAGFHIDLSENKDLESKSITRRIPSMNWVKVMFALSKRFPNQIMTAYGYNLSKTNTTLGFINLYLPQVHNLFSLKDQLYTDVNDRVYYRDFETMYDTFYTFKNACMFGTIGLKALEPAKLRDFMPKGTSQYAKGNDYKFTDIKLKPKSNEENSAYEERLDKAKAKYHDEIINFKIFKTWIIAMLNNKKELNALAERIAQVLIDFEDKSRSSDTGRGKSTQNRLSEDVKSSKSLKAFIENLTDLLAKYPEGATVFKQVKDAVIELPADLFPLFITLIRFEYQYKNSNNR